MIYFLENMGMCAGRTARDDMTTQSVRLSVRLLNGQMSKMEDKKI